MDGTRDDTRVLDPKQLDKLDFFNRRDDGQGLRLQPLMIFRRQLFIVSLRGSGPRPRSLPRSFPLKAVAARYFRGDAGRFAECGPLRQRRVGIFQSAIPQRPRILLLSSPSANQKIAHRFSGVYREHFISPRLRAKRAQGRIHVSVDPALASSSATARAAAQCHVSASAIRNLSMGKVRPPKTPQDTWTLRL